MDLLFKILSILLVLNSVLVIDSPILHSACLYKSAIYAQDLVVHAKGGHFFTGEAPLGD